MFFKLLKTRFFAENFNACVDSVSRKLGAWGVVLGYVFYVCALLTVFPVVCIYGNYFFHAESKFEFADLVLNFLAIFWLASAMLVIRFFAKKYSIRNFVFAMLLPILLMNVLPFHYVQHSDYVQQSVEFSCFDWIFSTEIILLIFVLLHKKLSHYRAFQFVGCILIFAIALTVYSYIFAGSKIFLGAIFVFWILSTAHILFRDKLLDYLEKKSNMAEEKNF